MTLFTDVEPTFTFFSYIKQAKIWSYVAQLHRMEQAVLQVSYTTSLRSVSVEG